MFEWAQSVVPGIPEGVYVGGAFLLLALCLRMKLAAALRQALMIGSGLIGVHVLNNFMFGVMVPAAEQVRLGWSTDGMILCTGMSTWFSAMMTLPFVVLIYPLGILINRLLLQFGFTKTADVDFINYFCFLTPAVPVWLYTKNVPLCLIIFAFFLTVNLKIADRTASAIQEFYQMEGVSVMHHAAGPQMLYCVGMNWVLDRLPIINRFDVTLGDLQKKLGFLGDPTAFCFLTGTVIGILSGRNLGESVMLGFAMTVMSQLFPKAIGVFMEGLSPIAARLRELMTKGLKTQEVRMGVDAAVLTGDPDVVAISALWMPVYVALHLLLPWSRVSPGPESFSVSMMVAVCLPFAGGKEKGNVFRVLVMLSVFTCVLMYTASYVAPYVTQLYAQTGGFVLPEGAEVTTSGAYHAYDALSYFVFKQLKIAQ